MLYGNQIWRLEENGTRDRDREYGRRGKTLVKLLATPLTHRWLSQMKLRDIISEDVPKSDTKAWESAKDRDRTAKVLEQEWKTLGM